MAHSSADAMLASQWAVIMNCYISAIGYYKGQHINQPIARKERDFVIDLIIMIGRGT